VPTLVLQLSDESEVADAELQIALDDADQLLVKVHVTRRTSHVTRHTSQVRHIMQLLGEARSRLEEGAAAAVGSDSLSNSAVVVND
jgi:hypothetical protein